MTFLQSFVLWGLPLALLPVLIHLFNRLRHRPMPWAAMMFLRSATRRSTRYARLRQWLVLLFRVLALATLVFALSRPLAGGWMGWLATSVPDTILVLLDRSASMETKSGAGTGTKRDMAADLMARTAAGRGQGSRLVVIDSVTMNPRELESADDLANFPWMPATGTSADLPAMMQAALDWLSLNRPGSVEIWIASDGQRSNWRPGSDVWAMLRTGLQALPQRLKVRLLMLNRRTEENVSLHLAEITRRAAMAGTGPELDLVLDVEREAAHVANLPLTVSLDGVPTQVEMEATGPMLRHRQRVKIPPSTPGGWGSVALPADANAADNHVFFVHGPPPTKRAAVVAEDEFVRGVLSLALAPGESAEQDRVEIWTPSDASSRSWDDLGLILWQGALPASGEDGQGGRLLEFVREGGVLVLFPFGAPGLWRELGWGENSEAAADDVFAVAGWDRRSGPLADSNEGWPLPLDDLGIRRRQALAGDLTDVAWFGDGTTLLGRRLEGRGWIYLCATLPRPDWSRLAEGAVLLPMLQRLIETGSARLSLATAIHCGQTPPAHPDGPWIRVGDEGGGNPAMETGVYRSGDRWLAVNWAPAEADRAQVDAEEMGPLLDGVDWQWFDEAEQGMAGEQAELWRWFLMAMVACLFVEAALILPEKPAARGTSPMRRPSNEPESGRQRAA